jgi:hypothetical protein
MSPAKPIALRFERAVPETRIPCGDWTLSGGAGSSISAKLPTVPSCALSNANFGMKLSPFVTGIALLKTRGFGRLAYTLVDANARPANVE